MQPPPNSPSLPQRLIRRIAATRPAAWFLSHAMRRFDALFLRLSGNRTTLASLLTGWAVAIVTTTGARSGLQRTSPLLYVRDPAHPERLVVAATNWGGGNHPAWYYNMKANPAVTVAHSSVARPYRAREAYDEEYARLWNPVSAHLEILDSYRQRVRSRAIPLMVLEPAIA